MKGAFTGTRKGMTSLQHAKMPSLIEELHITRAYHGAAKGADREFHGFMSLFPRELFPSSEEQHRWALSACSGGKDVIHPIDFNEIRRNHTFVDKTDVVIATPFGTREQFRGSGTWATMRYCLKIGKRLVIVWPSGIVTENSWR